jgi:hypothetical protein
MYFLPELRGSGMAASAGHHPMRAQRLSLALSETLTPWTGREVAHRHLLGP